MRSIDKFTHTIGQTAFSAPCRTRFRCHADHRSVLMPNTIPRMPISVGF